MPYKNEEFDAIISSAVLHFAEHVAHFHSMIREHTRVLKKNGILFTRMTTDIGIEKDVKLISDGKYLLPDDSIRFLLTRALLEEIINKYGFEFIEQFKTVIVENKRCMSTLVLRKT